MCGKLLFMKTMTIQLPDDIHADIKILADKEAKKLNLDRLSKVAYLRRLITREKAKS